MRQAGAILIHSGSGIWGLRMRRKLFIIGIMIKTIIFKILLGVYFVVWAPVIILSLITPSITRKMVIIEVHGILWMLRTIVGIRYEIIDKVPGRNGRIDRQSIIACKHMSIMESAILMTNYDNLFFIIKRELMMIPVYGWAFWRMGFVSVNRSRGATNMKQLAERAVAKIKAGGTLAVYPEGTRAKPGAGVKIKRGLLFIAEAAKLPIQTIGADTGVYWPKRGRMRGGVCRIFLEPVLPYNASLEDIAEAIGRNSA